MPRVPLWYRKWRLVVSGATFIKAAIVAVARRRLTPENLCSCSRGTPNAKSQSRIDSVTLLLDMVPGGRPSLGHVGNSFGQTSQRCTESTWVWQVG